MASSIVNTVFLGDAKLRQLAQLIRGHEINNMFHITFANVGEQLLYLRMINENMASINTILDDLNALLHRYRGDSVRRPIAGLIQVYVEHSLNNALQLIPNYTLRRDYLDKMLEHHKVLYETLEALNTSSQVSVRNLTEAIQELDHVIISYMRLSLNPHASAEFSRFLRHIGVSFQELVTGHQRQLGYTGMFENLETEQKLDVYASILERSGRMTVLSFFNDDLTIKAETDDGGTVAVKASGEDMTSKTETGDGGTVAVKASDENMTSKTETGDWGTVAVKASDEDMTSKAAVPKNWDLDVVVKSSAVLYSSKMPILGSAAMFLVDIGIIIWEVYSADHSMTTALRAGLIAAAEAGGATLGALVGVAAATHLTGLAATSVFVTAVGLVTSFVGAFIIGALVGFLFDRIFGSGGQAPLPTDGFVVYVAPMPNGHRLARQIA